MAELATMDLSTVAEAITCPITHHIMSDPVIGKDGHTYERSAIIKALMIKSESPITREYMSIQDLKVNPAIKFLCDKYHDLDANSEQREQVRQASASIITQKSNSILI